MLEKITSRFSFQAVRIDLTVVCCILVLWLVITACTVSSIMSQPFTRKQRMFWVVLVVALPLFGILAYLPFSFSKEAVPDIFLMKHKKGKKRSGAGGVTRQG